MTSPGGGVYYGRANTGLFRYLDQNPYDGKGSDLLDYGSDPVSATGWAEILISAQPKSLG